MSQLFDEAVQFTDEVTGELLVGGLLYIGANGLDAKLNPISIFSNRELTGTPLANPQTIGVDGRSENKIWLSGKYSFKVEDSANVQKYNELENGFDEQVGNTLLINALGVNDVVVNGSPTVTTLVDSQTYIFTAPADNTGAMTLKIDSTAALPLKIHHNQALASGDIKQDQKVVVVANLADNVYEVQTDLSGVTLNGVETLTNKTLTSPVISTPTIDGISNIATKLVLNTKVLDIGDWNMDATGFVAIAHGLTLSTIRGISLIIRDDTDSAYFFNVKSTGISLIDFDATFVSLTRATGGDFDSTVFDAIGFSRGWVTIQYTD